jgi:hypothetical protein
MSAIRESFIRGSRSSLPAIVGNFFSRWGDDRLSPLDGIKAEVGRDPRERPGVLAASPVDDPDRFDELDVFLADPALTRGCGTNGLGEKLSGEIDPALLQAATTGKLTGSSGSGVSCGGFRDPGPGARRGA